MEVEFNGGENLLENDPVQNPVESPSEIEIPDFNIDDSNSNPAEPQETNENPDDFNEFLDTIKSDGTFDEIVSKYFEGTGEKQAYSWNLPRHTGVERCTRRRTLSGHPYADGGQAY